MESVNWRELCLTCITKSIFLRNRGIICRIPRLKRQLLQLRKRAERSGRGSVFLQRGEAGPFLPPSPSGYADKPFFPCAMLGREKKDPASSGTKKNLPLLAREGNCALEEKGRKGGGRKSIGEKGKEEVERI